MTETNERWAREHRFAKRLTGYVVLASAALWPISYYTSFLAAQNGQGMWFAAVSVVTLLAAIGTAIGGAVCAGIVLTDEAPLPGSNY